MIIMIEKRFEVIDDGCVDIYDHNRIDIVCTCDMPNDAKKCCKLLNELHEENQRLKYHNKHQQNYINQLVKKPKLTDVLPQAKEIIEANDELEKENEKLRISKKKYERLVRIKEKEIENRINTINDIVEPYLNGDILFKDDISPNVAVKEVLEEILYSEVKEYE